MPNDRLTPLGVLDRFGFGMVFGLSIGAGAMLGHAWFGFSATWYARLLVIGAVLTGAITVVLLMENVRKREQRAIRRMSGVTTRSDDE